MRWISREQVNNHIAIATSRESWLLEANQYIDEELQRSEARKASV